MAGCENIAAFILPLAFLFLASWLIVQSIRTGRLTWSYIPKGKRHWQRTTWQLHHRRQPLRFRLQLAAFVLTWALGVVILVINAAERCGSN
jgi:hypothetical protein